MKERDLWISNEPSWNLESYPRVKDILSGVHLLSAVRPSPVAAIICPVDEGIVVGTKISPLV